MHRWVVDFDRQIENSGIRFFFLSQLNPHELLPLFVVRLIFTFGPWRTTKGTRSLATPLTNSVHSPNEAPVDCNLPINGQLREFRPIGGYQAKKQNKTSQKDDEGREWKSDSHLKEGEEREGEGEN